MTSGPNGGGLSTRGAVKVFIESSSLDAIIEWVHFDPMSFITKVVHYVGDFAMRRGVILEAEDIVDETELELRERSIIDPTKTDRFLKL